MVFSLVTGSKLVIQYISKISSKCESAQTQVQKQKQIAIVKRNIGKTARDIYIDNLNEFERL